MPGETVLRVLVVQFQHVRVPRHFGNDGRGGDLEHGLISTDHGPHGYGEIRAPISVHQGEVRLDGKLRNRPAHRRKSGLENVHPIDFFHVGPANAPSHGTFRYALCQSHPTTRAEAFAIVYTCDGSSGREYHRCGYDGPGKRPAAGLVDPGHGADPLVGVEFRARFECSCPRFYFSHTHGFQDWTGCFGTSCPENMCLAQPFSAITGPKQMKKLRVAVIGVGHLGKFHAQKYASLDDCELMGVADVDSNVAERVAESFATVAYSDYRKLLGSVDAVSIVVPARHHFPIARDALASGAHVLVEKPITTLVQDAKTLVDLAKSHGRVLQVGHLERFNPAVLALDGQLQHPLFVESDRIAPYNPRGTDVSVVLDLMIHDIDLILDLVDAPVDQIDASGAPILTQDIDIANARLRFRNGCVANVTASRVGAKVESKLRLFQADAYFSVDLRAKRLGIRRKGPAKGPDGVPEILVDDRSFEQGDALMTEIRHFVDCARNNTAPLVSGEIGMRALETAMEISRQLGTAMEKA